MIRVLHVVTSMGVGGIEVLLMNLYRHIDRTEVQFDFLVHREEESEFEAEILALGGRIHRVPPVNPLRHGRYLRALKDFFQTHPEYRIVHAHNNAFSMYVLRAAKRAGVPVCIAHSHTANVSFSIKRSPFYYYCRKRILRYTDYAFACSKAAGQWLFGKSILSNPIFRVFNNSIDCDRFAFSSDRRRMMRNELGIADELVIGHVGRFSPEKNHAFMLKVFECLLTKRRDAILLLAGEGPLMPVIQRQALDLGIADSVCFLGSRADVPELLQSMDVFLFPSIFEGIPVTLVEAQASGLPCLVSDTLSREIQLTTLVDFLPLTSGADIWATACRTGVAELPRIEYNDIVRGAGYHIGDASAFLQRFYLTCNEMMGAA